MEVPQVNLSRTVFVSNLSPAATEKAVSDFFSFCGRISKLYMKRDQDVGSAVVEFESESAAKTALLLSNALIVDRPINVAPYANIVKVHSGPEKEGILNASNQVASEDITARNFGSVTDEERTKTSVVASMLASGYVLAKDVVQKAQEVDTQHHISKSVKDAVEGAVETVRVKVNEVDEKLKISETAKNLSLKLNEKGQQFDDKHKISEKVRSASQSAKDTASNLAVSAKESASVLNQKVKENETINKGVTAVSGFMNQVGSAASNAYNKVGTAATTAYSDLSTQTKAAIAEKEQKKAELQGSTLVSAVPEADKQAPLSEQPAVQPVPLQSSEPQAQQ